MTAVSDANLALEECDDYPEAAHVMSTQFQKCVYASDLLN